MGLYATIIFPRLMDWVLRGERFNRERRHLLVAAEGRILELGFGTGLNLPHYPPHITSVSGVDPVRPLPQRIRRRLAQTVFPVTVSRATAEALPFPDAHFDCVVTTFTLCTIPDPVAALREVARVLKTDGRLLFLEHGRSDDPVVARWQDRLNPIQNVFACGCHLNRPIDQLMIRAGLRLGPVDRYQLAGVPRIMGEMYRGAATRPPMVEARRSGSPDR